MYNVDCDGTGVAGCEVYCEMQKAGGGWTMLINLQTSDGDNQHYDKTTFWTGTSPVGALNGGGTTWDNDYKGEAIFHMKPDEVMMLAHNNGAYMGHAVYSVLDAQKGKTLHELLATGSSVTWTGTSTSREGGVGANGRERNVGDAFVDQGYAVVINTNYKPSNTDDNYNRLGPNGWAGSVCETVNCNGHTFGGWGGKHYEGGWGSLYEGAAINGYCSSQGCFGSNNEKHPSTNPGHNACSSCSPQGHDVDMAVFVR